jgi:uncharacterized protein (TIGR03086 family)
VQRPKLRETFHAPGALELIGHHVIADMTGAQLLAGSVSETAMHTWDLIRATGQEQQLDPRLAEVAVAIYEQLAPALEASGFTAPRVDVSPDAPAQSRMAALTGRQP